MNLVFWVLVLALIIPAILIVFVESRRGQELHDHIPPTPPGSSEEEIVVQDPVPPAPPVLPSEPKDGNLPDPIDWENMSCDEIKQKIEDIKLMLMTSKWSDPRIYPFWVEQLEIGEKYWVSNCTFETTS